VASTGEVGRVRVVKTESKGKANKTPAHRSRPVIARLWRGWTKPEEGDAYEAFLGAPAPWPRAA
jgi:hypothetical protein